MGLRRALIELSMASRRLAPYRRALLGRAAGDALDLGCGGGANFAFLDPRHVDRVIGLEPDPASARVARLKARDLALPVFVREERAEAMSFPDNAFDIVVVTFALCTLTDPAGALAQARRVLRPGGWLLFLEHGVAPGARARALQRRLEPLNAWLGDGCHLTRDPVALLETAGFAIELHYRERLTWSTPLEGSLYGGVAVNLGDGEPYGRVADDTRE